MSMNQIISIFPIANMKTIHIKDFNRGWIVGNFLPSLVRVKDVEVAIMHRNKEFAPDGHYHTSSTEYNFIVVGRAISDGKLLGPGDCFVYEQNDPCEVQFLEDTIIVVVRTPSINDKVEVCKS